MQIINNINKRADAETESDPENVSNGLQEVDMIQEADDNNKPTPESMEQSTGQFPTYIQKQIKEMAENLGKQLNTQNNRNNGFELENSIMKQVEERRKNEIENTNDHLKNLENKGKT